MIKPLGTLVKEAAKELSELQSGEKQVVKTGMVCIDDHIGGLLPGDITIIAAPSGHGKSEFLYKMRESILNEEINEGSSDFIYLDYSLEMKVFNQFLRGLRRKTGVSKKNLLFKKFEEGSKEQEQAIEYYKKLVSDDRYFVSQDPITPVQFYNEAREFLIKHKDKKAVLISVDHILLVSGSDKKGVIDEVMEKMNQLKLEFSNVYFFVLSQMNRSLIARVAEKNNMAAPNSGDLYGSEFMQQAASYVIALYNAYKVGINQYMKVFPERYDHLSKHFDEEDTKSGRASFSTVGKIFQHVLKVREGEADYKDLFIEDMDIPKETLERMKQEQKVMSKPTIEAPPMIDMTQVTFNTPAINSARGVGFDDEPF
jgi:replicative DNA helicase